MFRPVALAVLVALLGAVCPSMTAATPGGHGCCEASTAGCPSLGATKCCAPLPGEASSSGTPAAPASLKITPDAPAPAVVASAPEPFATGRRLAADSHGISPVPPLLRSCLRRI